MAVEIFDLYGSLNSDLASVTSLISRILAMEFSIRSSDERGDYPSGNPGYTRQAVGARTRSARSSSTSYI
jgi:hypothetical protein